MAIGKYSDFKIIEDQYYLGITEVIRQAVQLFNGGSNNAIRMVDVDRLGNFKEESYFAEIGNLITRRDISSTAGVADLKLTSKTDVMPKLNRKLGPVANTLDSLKKIGSSQEAFSFYIGQQAAKAKLKDWLNTILLCGKTAISAEANAYKDSTGSTLSNTLLVDLIAMYGDAAGDIGAFVMHSVPFFELFKDGMTNYKIDRVAGSLIVNGVPSAMGRAIIVSDSPSLVEPTGDSAGTGPSYTTLGLTQNGLVVEESEGETVMGEWELGGENIVYRVQGEHAYNIDVKGYTYTDTTENPDDTALGTAGNWSLNANDVKASAGVAIETSAN